MKHREKIRFLIERIQIDKEFKERVMAIKTEKDLVELLASEGVVLEPDEVEKYYQGFLKVEEMEKTGEIPEDIDAWMARWNPDHNKNIKL